MPGELVGALPANFLQVADTVKKQLDDHEIQGSDENNRHSSHKILQLQKYFGLSGHLVIQASSELPLPHRRWCESYPLHHHRC